MRRPRRKKGLDADAYVLGLVSSNPNLLIPHFLLHSYAYYVQDRPIISDQCFDDLVQRLGAAWESVEHRHKVLLDRDILKSGFYLRYPPIVPFAVEALRRELQETPVPQR